jgi:tetratricopeptide (TPR) repeat protein
MIRTLLLIIILYSFNLQGQPSLSSAHHQASEEFSLGIQSGMNQQFKNALNHFNQACELNPDFSEAYLFRGITQIELKDYHSAISDLTRSLELEHTHAAKAYYFRGLARAALNDHPGAIKDLNRSIDLETSYSSFYQRGESYFLIGEFGRGLLDFEVCLRLKPGFAPALLKKGKTLFHIGKYNEAITELSSVIAKLPDNAEAYYYRSLAQRALGNELQAEEDLHFTTSINPGIKVNETLPAFSSPTEPVIAVFSQAPSEVISPLKGNVKLGAGIYDHNLVLSSAVNKGYGVQVASFSAADNLITLASSYHERYQQPVFIQITEQNNRRLYKIIIGGHQQRQQAEALRDTLRKTEFPDCFIVNLDQFGQ